MTATEQQVTALLQETAAFLRAEASAAFGDLQVILLRNLAARIRTGGTLPGDTLPLEASADQLEAALRELRHILRRGWPPVE